METLITPIIVVLFLLVLCGLAINIWIARKSKTQIALVLKSLFLSLKEQKLLRERIDTLRVISHEASDYNRKAADHQRVLLASLNRQLANLDTLLKSSQHIDGEQGTPSARPPFGGQITKTGQRPVQQGTRPAKRPGSLNKPAAVPLTRVLARVLEPQPHRQAVSNIDTGRYADPASANPTAMKSAKLTVANSTPPEIREHHQFEEFEKRRISNG